MWIFIEDVNFLSREIGVGLWVGAYQNRRAGVVASRPKLDRGTSLVRLLFTRSLTSERTSIIILHQHQSFNDRSVGNGNACTVHALSDPLFILCKHACVTLFSYLYSKTECVSCALEICNARRHIAERPLRRCPLESSSPQMERDAVFLPCFVRGRQKGSVARIAPATACDRPVLALASHALYAMVSFRVTLKRSRRRIPPRNCRAWGTSRWDQSRRAHFQRYSRREAVMG